jgi:hypothetical protein
MSQKVSFLPLRALAKTQCQQLHAGSHPSTGGLPFRLMNSRGCLAPFYMVLDMKLSGEPRRTRRLLSYWISVPQTAGQIKARATPNRCSRRDGTGLRHTGQELSKDLARRRRRPSRRLPSSRSRRRARERPRSKDAVFDS